jgi:cyclohexanecarboxylate-CoA ligase/acyl-CoA synthetase
MLGSWGEPERTDRAVDEQGWYHSGDLARADAEGYIRISGRSKDIIIRGGANISAGEVEGYLHAHPSVATVACVAFPHDRLGEGVQAFVVLRPGATAPDLAELKRFLVEEQGVAVQKVPERVTIVEELPTTPTGKVQKFLLREAAKREAAGE